MSITEERTSEVITPREKRQKWYDFLRVTGRQKTKRLLEDYRNPEARCFLGHACHIFLSDTREVKTNPEGINEVWYGDGVKENNILPESLAVLLDITPSCQFRNPVYIGTNDYGSTVSYYDRVSDLNDFTDMSLADIADVLEEEDGEGNLEPF